MISLPGYAIPNHITGSFALDYDPLPPSTAEIQAATVRGQILLRTKARGEISIKRWQQSAQSYSNDLMQTQNVPIGTYGCTLTSFTMIANYLRGLDYDPGQVNRIVANYACPFYYEQAGSRCSLTLDLHDSSRTYTTAELAPIVADSISNKKRPVMIGMAKGSNTHYVVAYAYSGELIYIKDPASYNYPTLQDYTNQGYIINRVYSYKY